MNKFRSLFFIITALCVTRAEAELAPEQVAVVANANSQESRTVAEHYLRKRDIPAKNLIALDLPQQEKISRRQYDEKLVKPLRRTLKERGISSRIRAVVTTLGVPLSLAELGANSPEHKIVQSALQTQNAARMGFVKVIALSIDPASAANFDKQQKTAALNVPERAKYSKLSNKELVEKADIEIRKALSKLDSISDDKEKQARSSQLSKLVLEIGGFSSLAKHLVPNNPNDKTAQSKAARQLQKMKKDVQEAQNVLGLLARAPNEKNRLISYSLTKRVFGLGGVLRKAELEIERYKTETSQASLDSELSLLWWDRMLYRLAGRLPNPLHYSLQEKQTGPSALPILMTSRIDAPSAELALKMIDNAAAAEKNGLTGEYYFDAQGLKYSRQKERSIWDKNIVDLAWQLRELSSLSINLDKYPELLNDAPNTAYYIGWYSLRNYRDVFSFRPGAIGYHIASAEAISIRNPEEKGWCRNMLARGAAATIGAVAEPYLDSFPLPSEFTAFLMSGQYSLVEAYFLSKKYISWRMVLFGDPLYRPFKTKAVIPADKIILDERSPVKSLEEFSKAPSDLPFADPVKVRQIMEAQQTQIQKKLDRIFTDKKKN